MQKCESYVPISCCFVAMNKMMGWDMSPEVLATSLRFG